MGAVEHLTDIHRMRACCDRDCLCLRQTPKGRENL